MPKGAASVAFTLICSRCEAGAFKLEVTSDGAQGWVSALTDVACKGTAALAATLPRQKPSGNETMLEVLARSLLSTRCDAATNAPPTPAKRVWGGLTYALRVTVDPPSIGATTFAVVESSGRCLLSSSLPGTAGKGDRRLALGANPEATATAATAPAPAAAPSHLSVGVVAGAGSSDEFYLTRAGEGAPFVKLAVSEGRGANA